MIFVLEDDESIRNLMLYTLHTTGMEAVGFPDSVPFWAALKEQLPDLILLDIMLPGEDGITVLKKLRTAPETQDVPVIMATAKGSEYDKVLGLDLGADDYLSKPFGMLEMVSRVRAVLRRTERQQKREREQALTPAQQPAQGRREAGGSPEVFCRDGVELNTASHTVTVKGSRVQLTLKEYELLRTFLSQPNRVFTRDELLADIWDAEFMGETRTVDVHIRTLRTKLGPCGDCIKTVRGVGYLWEAEDEE